MIIAQGSKNKTIFFEGNSLSNRKEGDTNYANGYRFPVSCYNLIRAAAPSVNIGMTSHAVGGQTTATMITNFSSVVAPYLKPNDVVIVWEIVNDIATPLTAQAAYNNIVTYCNLALNMGAKVAVCSTITSDGVNEATKVACDALIRSNWTSFAHALIDFRTVPHFQVPADAADTTYYNTDGTHLTNAGYDLLAAYAQPIIQTLL